MHYVRKKKLTDFFKKNLFIKYYFFLFQFLFQCFQPVWNKTKDKCTTVQQGFPIAFRARIKLNLQISLLRCILVR